eukprot:c19624_g1_i1.p1 GENE.c19624_g1_i1~~c19624_g1_i1.p1  ORF type:complete len:1006 (-),score=180.25 c19624_g1_i1:50-3067(-)
MSHNQIENLPSQIGLLGQLTWLGLNANRLTSVPRQIGRVHSLVNLRISHNKLSTLPAQIVKLSRLDFLDMGSNLFSSIPTQVGELIALKTLRANENRLTQLPSEIVSLENLRYLHLATNSLSEFPTQLRSLPYLGILNISQNQIRRLPRDIAVFTKMTVLDLAHNFLASLPPEITALTLMNYFDLSDNLFTDWPPEIFEFTNLVDLRFSDNAITTVPTQIGNLRGLKFLALASNSIREISTEIGLLTLMQELDFSDNLLLRLPTQIGKLTQVDSLFVSGNVLDSLPTQIGALSWMEFMYVHNNNALSEVPTQLGMLTRMEFLRLHGNQIHKLPTEIGMLSELQALDLSSNMLSGLPTQIGALTRLSFLFLSENRLTNSISSAISHMKDLTTLDLSFNELGGTFPSWLTKLVSLKYLMLHRNKIGGAIPTQISNLSNLRVLSLYGNRLDGSLPALYQESDSLVLLFRNRMSCPLPQHASSDSPTSPKNARTLIALGNLFRMVSFNRIGAERWLYGWDTDSTHLFLTYPPPWMRLLIMLCAVAVLGLVWARLKKKRRNIVVWPWPSQLWGRCLTVCLIAVALGLIHVVRLVNSSSIHQCADPLARMTLSEETGLSQGLCGWVFASCILWCVVNFLGVIWLRRLNSLLILPLSSNSESLLPPQRNVSGTTPIWWKIILWITWGILISTMSAPSFLNLAVSFLPANNSLGVEGPIAKLLQFLVSPLLVFASDTWIPKLCVWFVSQYRGNGLRRMTTWSMSMGHRTIASGSEDTDDEVEEKPEVPQAVTTELILFSQLIVLVALPLVARLIFDEHCLGVARDLWNPCEPDHTDFDVTIDVIVQTDRKIEAISVDVLTQASVCNVSWRINDPEMCVRGVIVGSSSLVVSKVVVQTLLMMVRGTLREILKFMAWDHRFASITRRIFQESTDLVMTRSILSLMLLGFAFGGTAPLVWVVVLFGILTIRMGPHHLTQSNHRRRDALRVPWMLLAGPVIQSILVAWFLSAANLCA